MKRSEGDATTKEPEVNQDHLKIVQFYREKMNSQSLHSALRSFNVQDGARTSGVYEIYRNNEVSMRDVLPPVILSDPMQYCGEFGLIFVSRCVDGSKAAT